MRRLSFCFCFLLFFSFAAVVCAQSTSSTLVGIVRDPSGAAVPGVSVVATQQGTNTIRRTTTNDSGLYSIPNVEAGGYVLVLEKAGFKKAQVTVDVPSNESRRADVRLEVGAISQVVQVDASNSGLQTDTSSISGTVNTQQIQDLPSNGRFIDQYIQLLTGASRSAPNSQLSSRGGLNMDGVDEHYQSYFVDGTDNVDTVIRNFSYRPSLDGVAELRVEQSGYRAEFGRNAGAVVNVITKSGTNDWHGSLWEFFRNDNLDARNYFATTAKPALLRNQFGGTLGGPIKKDRTFVFGWFEAMRQKVGQVRLTTVPTEKMRMGDLSEINRPSLTASQIDPIAADILKALPLPNLPGLTQNRLEIANRIEDDNNFSARIDHQLSASTKIMGRWSGSFADVLDPFRTETGSGSNFSAFGQTADRFRTNIGINVVSVLATNVVNEFRGGFNRFRQPLKPINVGTALEQPLMGFVKAFPFFSVNGFDSFGSQQEFRRVANVYDYVDSVSWVHGTHQFKFGVDTRRYLFNGWNVPTNIFSFSGGRAGSGISDFLQGLPSAVISFNSLNGGSPGGNTRKFEFAGYAQDDWKVTPTLTLNYGLRWEYYGRMTERTNKQSLWVAACNCLQSAGVDRPRGLVDNDFNNFAPRVGLAWRPFGERAVIRASGGIFYDNDQRHNTEVFTNPPFFFSREYIFGPTNPTLSNPFPTTGLTFSTLRPNTLDLHYRDTYAEQWNLNFQYELPANLIASVSYSANHTLKARRQRNVNQSPTGTGSGPYAGYSTITIFEQAGSSTYNALQVHMERRFSKGLGLTSSYTLGHAIDNRPGQGSFFAQDSYQMDAERGDSDFDVRHTWVTSASYDLPVGKGRMWGGWSLNAISTSQSGRPFTVLVNAPASLSGLRPNLTGIPWKPASQRPDNWIDAAAFVKPVSGTFGNLGRNTLRGPGLYNLDLSLVKTQNISGNPQLQLRAEFFNILNHPNFTLPTNYLGATLGKISATATPERQIQFGVKLSY